MTVEVTLRNLLSAFDVRHKENQEAGLRRDEIQRAQSQILEKILNQTTATNGRVNKHDEEIKDLRATRDWAKGAVAAAVASAGAVGAIIGYVLAMHKT